MQSFMNHSAVRKAGFLAALTVLGIFVPHALASRNMMAEGGIAWPNQSDIDCFEVYFGEIVQKCDISNRRTVDFMLPIDSTGSKAPVVTARSSLSGAVICGAFAIGQSGAGIAGATTSWNNTGYQTRTLAAVSVPSNGSLGMFCQVGYNESVRMMRW